MIGEFILYAVTIELKMYKRYNCSINMGDKIILIDF